MTSKNEAQTNHPIPLIDQTIRSLKGGDVTPYFLEEAAAKELEKALADLFESPDLAIIVAELCVLAGWLEKERNSPQAREVLLNIAATAIPVLKARGGNGFKTIDDLISGRSVDYTKFTGSQLAQTKSDTVTTGEDAVSAGPMARFNLDAALPKRGNR